MSVSRYENDGETQQMVVKWSWSISGPIPPSFGFLANAGSPVHDRHVSPRSHPRKPRKQFVVLAVVERCGAPSSRPSDALALKSCVYTRRQCDIRFQAERWLPSSLRFSSVLVSAEVMTGNQNKQGDAEMFIQARRCHPDPRSMSS